jgi:hypothetical protein
MIIDDEVQTPSVTLDKFATSLRWKLQVRGEQLLSLDTDAALVYCAVL